MDMYKKDGEKVGLYDVCEWFDYHYPSDIFRDLGHPVTRITLMCRDILREHRKLGKRLIKKKN